jgi:hypothetical protein
MIERAALVELAPNIAEYRVICPCAYRDVNGPPDWVGVSTTNSTYMSCKVALPNLPSDSISSPTGLLGISIGPYAVDLQQSSNIDGREGVAHHMQSQLRPLSWLYKEEHSSRLLYTLGEIDRPLLECIEWTEQYAIPTPRRK